MDYAHVVSFIVGVGVSIAATGMYFILFSPYKRGYEDGYELGEVHAVKDIGGKLADWYAMGVRDASGKVLNANSAKSSGPMHHTFIPSIFPEGTELREGVKNPLSGDVAIGQEND